MIEWNADRAELFEKFCDESYSLARRLMETRPNRSGSIQDLPARHVTMLVDALRNSFEEQDYDHIVSSSEDLYQQLELVGLSSPTWLELYETIDLIASIKSTKLLLNTSDEKSRLKLIETTKSILEKVRGDRTLLDRLTAREFEFLVAELFEKNGFSVTVTQESRDGGVDVIALKTQLGVTTRHLIECKKFGPDNKVGLSIVQRLYGITTSEKANQGIIVTTSTFSSAAVSFAGLHPWQLALKDRAWLLEWLQA